MVQGLGDPSASSQGDAEPCVFLWVCFSCFPQGKGSGWTWNCGCQLLPYHEAEKHTGVRDWS